MGPQTDTRRLWGALEEGALDKIVVVSPHFDANVSEQYWRLDPPPPGWARLSSADELDAGGRADP